MAWGMTEWKGKMLELVAAAKSVAELRDEINAEAKNTAIISCQVQGDDEVEIHVMNGLEEIARTLGKDIDVKHRPDEKYGHEFSITVLGVEIFQLGR